MSCLLGLWAAPLTGQVDPDPMDPLPAQLGAIEDRYGCQADRQHTGASQNDHMATMMDAGDWNGDGISDVLTASRRNNIAPCEGGEPCADDPPGSPPCVEVGRVWLYLGNPTNADDPAVIEFVDIPTMDGAGPPIAFIGDIDDDGGDDIAIGLPTTYHHSPGPNAGSVWIFLSSTTAPGVISFLDPFVTPDVVLNVNDGIMPGDPLYWTGDEPHFGFSIDSAGGVNGDGEVDLVVGAPGSFKDTSMEPRPGCVVPQETYGRVFIFAGQPYSEWQFGGQAYVAWASLIDPKAPDLSDPANKPGRRTDRFGWTVTGAGNINGDETASGNPLDDVVVGAIQAGHVEKLDFKPHDTGVAYLYLGQEDPEPFVPVQPVQIEIKPPVPIDGSEHPWLFGFAIAGGADITGDGQHDLLIGSPFYDQGDFDKIGAVYAYSWDPASDPANPMVRDAFDDLQPIVPSTEPQPGDVFLIETGAHFGFSVAMVGDYDKNEVPSTPPEFVVGALRSSNDLVHPGNGMLMPPCIDDPDPAVSDPIQGGGISGRVFVLHVAGDGDLGATVQCVYKGESATKMRLGTSVAAGDFDGDGFPDIAGGGSGFGLEPEPQEFGRFYIFSNATAP